MLNSKCTSTSPSVRISSKHFRVRKNEYKSDRYTMFGHRRRAFSRLFFLFFLKREVVLQSSKVKWKLSLIFNGFWATVIRVNKHLKSNIEWDANYPWFKSASILLSCFLNNISHFLLWLHSSVVSLAWTFDCLFNPIKFFVFLETALKRLLVPN